MLRTAPEVLNRSAPIDFAAVRYSRDKDKSVRIIDRIDDAIVSDPNSKVIAAGQLRDPVRSWLIAQAVDSRDDPLTS